MTARTPDVRVRFVLIGLFISFSFLLSTSHLFAVGPPAAEPPAAEPQQQSNITETSPEPVDPNAPEANEQQAMEPEPTERERELGELRDEVQGLEIQNAVDSFSEFVTSFQRDQAYQDYINTYSIRGLRSLTHTLGTMIRADDARLVREQATLHDEIVRIESMPAVQRETSADRVKNAFIDAATLFVNVQRQYYPDFDRQAQHVASLAASIGQESSLREQASEINDFFLAANQSLEQMARAPLNPVGGGPLPNPGQSIPAQTTPGQNVPGQNVPGQTTPGQNVPGQNIENDWNDLEEDDDLDEPGQPSTLPGEERTDPFEPEIPFDGYDPLQPSQPVSPSEPLDPTDPMEITPLAPVRPFDASNPEETAPLDF